MNFEPTVTQATLDQLQHQALLNVWVSLMLGLSQFIALFACICLAFRWVTAAQSLLVVYGLLVFLIGNELGVTLGALIMCFAAFGIIYGRMKRRAAAQEAADTPPPAG